MASGFAPTACIDIELYLSFRSHAHQYVLQGISAPVPRVEPLLEGKLAKGFFQRGEYVVLLDHN
jgi:hypothetical protein